LTKIGHFSDVLHSLSPGTEGTKSNATRANNAKTKWHWLKQKRNIQKTNSNLSQQLTVNSILMQDFSLVEITLHDANLENCRLI